jgi:hypothetical protein
VLTALCKDAGTVVELFLNYDCEDQAVYQMVIATLKKVSLPFFVFFFFF